MADPTEVNSQITDLVTQSDVPTREIPAAEMGKLNRPDPAVRNQIAIAIQGAEVTKGETLAQEVEMMSNRADPEIPPALEDRGGAGK